MEDSSEKPDDTLDTKGGTSPVQKLPFSIMNLAMGGPMSAFSSLSAQDSGVGTARTPSTDYTDLYRDYTRFKSGERSGLPSLFSRRPELTSDIPIAPAFAQIFQRRRRRENRPRRQRTTFTSEQTLKLELEYNRAEYITRPRRFELAEMLSLTESQIKIWFQNRRAKDKRIEKAHMDHQLRAMGYGTLPGPGSLPVSYQAMCGACLIPPPTSLPASSFVFNSPSSKPFKLL